MDTVGHVAAWVKVAGSIVAIIAGAATIVPVTRALARWFGKCFLEVKFMFHQRKAYTDLNEKLDLVLAEFHTNGGSSLRDSVNRIEQRIDFLGASRRAQLNISDKALVETNSAGQVIWANRMYLRLVGLPEKDILGSGWVNTVVGDERAWAQEAFERAITEGREFDEIITHRNQATDEEFAVRVMGHPIHQMSGDKSPHGYLAELARV